MSVDTDNPPLYRFKQGLNHVYSDPQCIVILVLVGRCIASGQR